MNTDELKRLIDAWANRKVSEHAVSDFLMANIDAIIALAEENARLREALGDIATDKREHTDDEVAIIYRMQDRAKAALEGAEP